MKKIFVKKIVLLTATLLVLFIAAEIFFRAYYSYTGQFVAADDIEHCLKELKLKKLPTDKVNFVNFTRVDRWDYDPLIGATSKKNYNEDHIERQIVNGKTIHQIMYDQHHHNNQGMVNLENFTLYKTANVSVRIALFGDSFTCGDQAPLLYSMGYVLKALINKSEVLNLCVSGRGIDTMYARYILEGKNYSPDVVWFNIFVDDLARAFVCPLETPNLTIANGRLVLGPRLYRNAKELYDKYQPPTVESFFVKHALSVYDQHTRHARNMAKGLALLDVMLNEMKRHTKEANSTFFVSAIQAPNPNPLQVYYYQQIKELATRKNIPFFDSNTYFKTNNELYHNQSFYYFKEGRGLGHYSVIGNALHAQGMKEVMASTGIIPITTNYYFANFHASNPLLLIPEDFGPNKQNFRTLLSYSISTENVSTLYSNATINVIDRRIENFE
ncbi:SGNH/GDSL hydrolase family protein [Candidatus Woesearchaeota archaeon]|nr:SGNH/GDSL hydrolase family protein [Candidatus Woesearchaeota archaeon]